MGAPLIEHKECDSTLGRSLKFPSTSNPFCPEGEPVPVVVPRFRAVLCFPVASGEPRGQAMSLESITKLIREEISKLNQVLHLLEGGAKKTRARRKMSAAGRKRISLAQKARWKKVRAGK